MKTTRVAGCVLLACFLAQSSVAALTVITLVQPQDLDPAKLTISVDGQLYTEDDASNPITGNTLLSSGLDGLEIHGAIPNSEGPGTDPIDELDMYSDYSEPVLVETRVATKFGNAFVPWNVQDVSTSLQRHWIFTPKVGSAPLNQGQYFGLIIATSSDPNFASAHFAFQGMADSTPEPGPTLMVLAAAIGAGLILRPTRRRNSARMV